MKKEYSAFFGNFFGGKIQPTEPERSTTVITTSYSQPHVLQQKMQEERLSHGETVTVNISPVRLERDYGKMVMYFCPMKSIEVIEKINLGDGGSIPSQVKVEGLTIPDHFKPGFYKLKNVMLTSNGSMQVIATEKTIWETAQLEHS